MLEQIDTQAPENPAFGMGMAWQLQPPTPNFPQSFAKKNGDSSGSNCITLLVPDSGWSITILANGGNAAMIDPAAVNLMHDLVPRRPIFGSSTGSSSGSDAGFQTGSFG
jgi:D-alanyl-D-alanine-carboxypeptidase/D-alanyl-D-alanine-endopeptidase